MPNVSDRSPAAPKGRRRSARLLLAAAMLAGAAGTLGGCGILGKKDKPATPTVGNRVPVLSRVDAAAQVDPALAGVAVVVPEPQANAEWPQAGGGPTHAIGNLALGEAPARAWSVQIAGSDTRHRLAAAPVIGAGVLYAVDTAGTIHAFDAATGARRWEKRAAANRSTRDVLFGGGASYADGRLYATNGTGEVFALDAATGAEIWRVVPAGPLRGAPTIAFGSIYVVTQDNRIVALAQADGAVQWQDSGSTGLAGVFGVASPAAGQGTLIAGYSTGELAAYRYENGRELWSDALARTSISTAVGTLTDIDADPIIDRGFVYALGQGGRMAAYELVTGQRVWELALAGISTPAIAGEWIFTLTDQAQLLAIARSNGRVRWITQLAHYRKPDKRQDPVFWTGPVLANNRLWAANTLGEIVTADVETGTPVPFAQLRDPVSVAPVVAGGMLYVLDDGGTITAWR